MIKKESIRKDLLVVILYLYNLFCHKAYKRTYEIEKNKVIERKRNKSKLFDGSVQGAKSILFDFYE